MSNPFVFFGDIDLSKFQLLNFRIQNLGTAPGSPAVGQTYYDTGANTVYTWNGTSWLDLGGSGGTTSPLTTKGDLWGYSSVNVRVAVGSNKQVLNADSTATPGVAWVTMDHTWISDFDTQVRTSRLDQMANPTAAVSLNSQKLTNVQSGTASTDGVNKGQLDAATQGLTGVKDPVRVIATTNGTLATAYANGQTVDGVTLATGDRILLAGQTTAADNGIYTVNASGAPTRAIDADASGEIKVGTYIYVQAGTANAGTQWVASATGANPWVPGSSSSTWTFFFQATATQAGAGLTAPGGNTLAVGAGTGIVANANDVAIDTAVVVRKFAQDIGNASLSSFTVTHSLGTKDVQVGCRRNSDDAVVMVPWVATSTSAITVDFGSIVPTSNQYRVIVQA